MLYEYVIMYLTPSLPPYLHLGPSSYLFPSFKIPSSLHRSILPSPFIFLSSIAHLTHILSQRQNGEPLNAIHLALKTQYINPFLTKEERQEIEFLTHSRKHLMSQTRLFLLEQSYPQ